MSIFRTIIACFLLLLISVSAVCGFFYYQLMTPLLTKSIVVEVKAGEHKADFAKQLNQLELLSYPYFYAAYMQAQAQTIKRGEYLLKPGASLYSIWQQVSKGTGFYYRTFTIVPGWTVQQLRQVLLATPTLRHEAAYQSDTVWSQVLKITVSPEGVFFPETYFYTKGTSDWVILKTAKRLMDIKLASLWEKRAPSVPFKSSYEALIAASLVEKEAYYQDERPVIAGVLINRLRKNMLLQFDPTVIYGLRAQYNGKLRAADLKFNTPYNTYLNKGLPPTPIAFPSMQSIEAVLHPSEHQYLYFVVEKEKRHRFSTTLDMHQVAVSAYRKQEKQKK